MPSLEWQMRRQDRLVPRAEQEARQYAFAAEWAQCALAQAHDATRYEVWRAVGRPYFGRPGRYLDYWLAVTSQDFEGGSHWRQPQQRIIALGYGKYPFALVYGKYPFALVYRGEINHLPEVSP